MAEAAAAATAMAAAAAAKHPRLMALSRVVHTVARTLAGREQLPASLAALGLLTLVPGSTNQLKVHELRSTDTKTVCDLRTAVFSSDLQGAYTKILQGRKWEESMQEKTKVLVARASRELADELLAKDDFVGYAGDEAEPIIGTADMQLVPIPGQDGACCYVNNVCVDPCAEVVCQRNFVCVAGDCVFDNCLASGCPEGERYTVELIQTVAGWPCDLEAKQGRSDPVGAQYGYEVGPFRTHGTIVVRRRRW
mgnify:CR=1 FL=1